MDLPDKAKGCCLALVDGPTCMVIKSPFSKQIILYFYDGTLSSVLQCASCQRSFLSQIIDWDSNFDRRVFALHPLPAGVFEQVCCLFTHGDQQPKWPDWLPSSSSDEGNERAMDEALATLLSTAAPPCVLVLTDRYIRRILAWRVPEAEVIEEIRQSIGDPIQDVATPTPTRDWFAYLATQR